MPRLYSATARFLFVTLPVNACRENDVEKTNSSSRSFIAAISNGGILDPKRRHAR
jgi:hypothetical protein